MERVKVLHNVFLKTIRDYRYALLWWALGIVGICFYLMYFYPYINKTAEFFDVIEHLPPIIKNLIGDQSLLKSPEGFFSIQPFSMMAPLLFIIFGITKGGDSIAGENERGTLELLLSIPISRSRLIVEKTAAIGASLSLLAITFWLGMYLGSVLFRVDLNGVRLAGIIISCFGLGFFFVVLTVFISSLWQKKKLSIGIASGYAIIAYLINAYAPMVEILRSLRIYSVFYYYNGARPLINGLNGFHFFILLVLTFIFFTGAVVTFRSANLSQ